jgi:hypothetical protein
MKKGSFDSLGPATAMKMSPDRQVRKNVTSFARCLIVRSVQEPALQIQDTIFLQAVGGAIVISAVAVGIFACDP